MVQRSSPRSPLPHHPGPPLLPVAAMVLAGVALLPMLLRPELPEPLMAVMPLPKPRLDPTDFLISPEREAVLFSQLDAADREWQPKAMPIPGGGTRYSYKRRAGDPPLSLEQIKLLMLHPPTFVEERRTIALLLQAVRRSGASVVLGPPRKHHTGARAPHGLQQ